MKEMKFHLVSRPGSDLFYGKPIMSEKKSDETHDAFEHRIWQEKIHIDEKTGQLLLTNFGLKNALETAGKFLSKKIPGAGKKTYTDRIRKGLLVVDRLRLTDSKGNPLTLDNVKPLRLFVPSDGKRGGAKRVFRIFPCVSEWEADAVIFCLDNLLDQQVIAEHLQCAGMFVGFGSMRIENGGANGMFSVAL